MNIFTNTFPNTECYPSYRFHAFAKGVNDGSGTFRIMKLAQNILKIIREILLYIGEVLYIPQVSRAISHFGSGCKALVLSKLFSSSSDLIKTYSKSNVTVEKVVYDTLEFASDIVTASDYMGVANIAKVSSFTGIVNRFIDTKKHLEAVIVNDSEKENQFKSKCSAHRKYGILSLGLIKHPILKEESPAELRKIAMIKLAKDIISISLAIISIVAILFGVKLICEISTLILSTISITLALTAGVISETTSHKVALLNAGL